MLSLSLYTNIFKIGNSFPVNDFLVSSLGWLEAIFAVECDMQPPNAAVAVAPGLELAAAYRRTVSPAHRFNIQGESTPSETTNVTILPSSHMAPIPFE